MFATKTSATVTEQTLPAATKKLAYNCPPGCSLSPSKTGQRIANIVMEMRLQGAGRMPIKARMEGLLDRRIGHSTVASHLNHFVELSDEPPMPLDAPRPNDIAILDAIIGSGFRNSRNWKPTIRDTLDAMKLKAQMTGQSAFEDMLAAMDAAMELPEDEIEAEEAILAPEERETDEPDAD